MSEENNQNTAFWSTMTPDPRSPFFERDLRRFRWQLTRHGCLLVIDLAREKLADACEALACRMRPKVNVNSVRLS